MLRHLYRAEAIADPLGACEPAFFRIPPPRREVNPTVAGDGQRRARSANEISGLRLSTEERRSLYEDRAAVAVSKTRDWGAARQRTDGRLQAGDELADQFRAAEDPRGRHEEGHAGQSLAQMPRLRADAVLSRARGQSSCLPQLRASSAHRRDAAPEVAVRRRRASRGSSCPGRRSIRCGSATASAIPTG